MRTIFFCSGALLAGIATSGQVCLTGTALRYTQNFNDPGYSNGSSSNLPARRCYSVTKSS